MTHRNKNTDFTSESRALVPLALAPFEADVNLSNVRELQAEEARRIITSVESAARREVIRDVLRRAEKLIADGASVPVIELRSRIRLAAERAQMRMNEGGTPEDHRRIVDDFWGEIRPFVHGRIELPIDRAIGTTRLLPSPAGEPPRFFPARYEPSRTGESRFKFSPGRELVVVERIKIPEEGTTFLGVINPQNIIERLYVDIGPGGAWAEMLPETSQYFARENDPIESGLPGISARQDRALGHTAARFQSAVHGRDIVNRTVEHRLVDHERLLSDLQDPGEHPGLIALAEALEIRPSSRMVIIDIGPGIANIDRSVVNDCKGKPAITSQELAEDFPNAEVIILDLPEQVRVFFGLDPLTGPVIETRRVNGQVEQIDHTKEAELHLARERDALLAHGNMHVIAGNGLQSLRAQIENPAHNFLSRPDTNRTNTVREIPPLTPETTVVIRAANSIDVYCKWDEPNGLNPSLRNALRVMAEDFREHPVLLLFNRAILLKRRGETTWCIAGRVSDAGFNSTDRNVTHSGRPSYELDPALITGHLGRESLVEPIN